MTEPFENTKVDPDARKEGVFVLRGGAYLLDEHAGVLIDSAGNYSAKTRGNPRSLAVLLRAVADDIEESEGSGS
jgi:hypothetical protein